MSCVDHLTARRVRLGAVPGGVEAIGSASDRAAVEIRIEGVVDQRDLGLVGNQIALTIGIKVIAEEPSPVP